MKNVGNKDFPAFLCDLESWKPWLAYKKQFKGSNQCNFFCQKRLIHLESDFTFGETLYKKSS